MPVDNVRLTGAAQRDSQDRMLVLRKEDWFENATIPILSCRIDQCCHSDILEPLRHRRDQIKRGRPCHPRIPHTLPSRWSPRAIVIQHEVPLHSYPKHMMEAVCLDPVYIATKDDGALVKVDLLTRGPGESIQSCSDCAGYSNSGLPHIFIDKYYMMICKCFPNRVACNPLVVLTNDAMGSAATYL
ncbi:hypothetical protein Salat_2090400 [Sesamum alatum]|uniref:Uncharacterized protein n=1 Tax=Sesamum alatum TaxID=300844 RepID=A0AAE2CGM5_9LAMI|nr:hypothetical protein Salat_2090400 [Sesamum alatum]